MLLYCPGRYKTQTLWSEAVDDFLRALKCALDWLVTSKILEKFHDDILFLDEDFNKVMLMKWVFLV